MTAHRIKLGFFAALVALAAVLLGGCAALRAASERNRVVNERTAQHVYNLPCGNLWPAVQNLLFERGYAGGAAVGMLVIETQWRAEVRGSQTWYSRYLVQGMAPTPAQCQVIFNKNETQSPGVGSPYNTRDLDAEWVLLQRMDHARAEQIAAEANAAGDRAAAEK